MSDKDLPKGVYTKFDESMSYADYLSLSTLLDAQNPITQEHDEPLFIMIHHISELWMKLAIHELDAAAQCLRDDNLRPSFKMLSRVSAIQSQLIETWGVLSTMTPADYLKFRDNLGQSSGFQSHQYRHIEFFLGNKKPSFLSPHKHNEEIMLRLTNVLNKPSLYDESILLLQRRNFHIDHEITDRDWSIPHKHNESVQAAWLAVYRDTDNNWDLYELAEKLVDLEDSFQRWRFRHLITVQRIIGHKRGTGGTSGVDYLAKALEYRFFPELWDVRTIL
ncbi:MAG: tryptophan 2,3-dioxygenase [Rhodospirillales bacterium]|jgi:tryptophan 2,3-dioxygenase|nr:tryptophan 2,3-dioxygenase [Rhodospirillales bacterium]